MSTEFYNRNWRMPKSSNSSKVSNYSMSFDGSSEYIDLTQHDLGTINTISLWLNISSITSAQTVLGEPSNAFKQSVIIASNIIYIKDVSNHFKGWNLSTSSEFSLNNWHHFGIVRSGSTVTFYIDGVDQGSPDSSSGAFTANTKFRYLGTNYPSNSQFVNGKIDHLAIFDYALSSSQITSLYGSSSTGVGNPMAITGGRKPVSYYPIGDYAAFNGSEYLVNNGALQDYVFDFDIGTNDYIDLGTGVSQSFSELSISTWINVPSSASGAYDTIIRRGTWSAGAFELRNNASYAGLKFAIYPGTANVTTTGVTLNDGNWHHILITYDGTNVKIYVDGSLNNSSTNGTGATGTSTQITTIGASDQGTSRHYEGKISNLVLWDSDQSANISNIYNNGTPQTSYTTPPTGWWKLDASATFDGSNWSIPDDSSNSNTGTSSGMTAANLVQSTLNITTPYSRYALNFDGSNDSIALNTSTISFANSFSISMWIKPNSLSSFQMLFGGSGYSGGTGIAHYIYNDTVWTYVSSSGTAVAVFQSSSLLNINEWTHIIIQRNVGVNWEMWINGVLEETNSTTQLALDLTSANSTIAKHYNSSYNFNGQLSNISIWNASLSSAQITELYNEGKPSNLNSHSAYSNLVSWWQLGENSSFDGTNWTVLNEISTGPNGTSANMTESQLLNGVGTTGNGLSDGMGGADNIIGDAPYSTANAVSYGMGVDAKSTSVPS
jgi:hypothetical protein